MVTLIELPLVLPPAVAGIGLLAAVGPRGLLAPYGVSFTLSTAAVVVALDVRRGAVLPAPGPGRVRRRSIARGSTRRARSAPSEARTLARVAIPSALPGLSAGLALAWGRALGEFGATLMFAGSFQGITQTVPLAIYERFATDFTGALGLSAVLVCVSAALLLAVKLAFRAAG